MLAVLLLRGAQTPGELKARSERMAPLSSLDDVDRVLAVLTDRGYGRRLDRRPGQKEDRFEQLLGGGGQADAADRDAAPVAEASAPAVAAPPVAVRDDDLESRVAALETEVATLRAELARLRGDEPAASQVGGAAPIS